METPQSPPLPCGRGSVPGLRARKEEEIVKETRVGRAIRRIRSSRKRDSLGLGGLDGTSRQAAWTWRQNNEWIAIGWPDNVIPADR